MVNFLRDIVDAWYDKNRDAIFAKTEHDPEQAHHHFVKIAQLIHIFGLEKLLLHCPENDNNPGFEISNAGGFNKNGDLPPIFLRYLGFDRVVVGTVTGDPWEGNVKDLTRIKRYVETDSMVNWLGLPGVGAEQVAFNLDWSGDHRVPLTINIMSTPGKKGEQLLQDLEKTVSLTRDLPYVDRFELNISCPNTHGSSQQVDARKEYQQQIGAMLSRVKREMYDFQELDLKVSPDLDREGVKAIVSVAMDYEVRRFTTTNTTTFHDPTYVTSPPNPEGKGGASGNAVYERAKNVQQMFYEEIVKRNLACGIIACGGINSAQRALERTSYGKGKIEGIQLLTPLIFEGPKLLRELRRIYL
ncbi:hypothetical protein HYV87_04485 [Candidatus Woesearchaeota archaeon]|nr:hypothetical protein [Candidatus Woesearchaeota archaeon]